MVDAVMKVGIPIDEAVQVVSMYEKRPKAMSFRKKKQNFRKSQSTVDDLLKKLSLRRRSIDKSRNR